MAMNRAQFRKELQEGLNTVFGVRYKQHEEEWRKLYSVHNSKKAYEEDVLVVGLGAAPVKPEGGGVAYDEGAESWVARYDHQTIALAFALTQEAEEDNLYGSLGARYTRFLARSMQHTKEIFGANTFNFAFDSNVPFGDGQPLLSTAHPLWGGGTLSNTLATPADLSEASLEAMLIQIDDWTDDRGIPVQMKVKKLAIPTNLQFVATRILMSPYRVQTADNDINALNANGSIPEFCVNHRFTDPNAWFLITDAEDGLKHFVRVRIQRGLEGDFETGNLRYKARERYSFGVSDWRGIAGSEGGGS